MKERASLATVGFELASLQIIVMIAIVIPKISQKASQHDPDHRAHSATKIQS
jgi:hypothetical protein